MKNLEEMNDSISKVNWATTTEIERSNFATAITTFELAKKSQIMAQTAASARLVTFVTNAALTLILIFFNVEPGMILCACLGLQLVLFGLSQLFEYGANVLLRRSEALMLNTLDSLAKRHPLDLEKNEDIFIL